MYVCVCVCVCIYLGSISLLRHFLSTYFSINPLKLPYGYYNFHLELGNKPFLIYWCLSTF